MIKPFLVGMTCMLTGLLMYDTSFAQGLERDLANSRVSIDGFASIAVAEPITKNLERSINDFRQLDNNTDWQSYNVLGLRLGYELGDRLNFTAQMVVGFFPPPPPLSPPPNISGSMMCSKPSFSFSPEM